MAGVAARLAALSLTRSGRLTQAQLCSDAVHCGLLVDLALAGRLEQTDDAVVVDATPTGFGPADDLLALLVAEPDRSLAEWIEDPRIGLADVVDALVEDGSWTVERRLLRHDRHRPADGHVLQQDLDLIHHPDLAEWDDQVPRRRRTRTPRWTVAGAGPGAVETTQRVSARWTTEDAVVTVLAGTAAMLGEARERGYGGPAPEVPERVLAGTGAARWVCEPAVAHLAWARQWRRYQAGVLDIGSGGTPG